MDSATAARSALWMLAGAVAFALMGTCTHALAPRCDWLVVALTRAVFMFASSALLATAAGKRLAVLPAADALAPQPRRQRQPGLQLLRDGRLPVADALTLTSMYPLWIVVFSAALPGGRRPSASVGGMASGLLGVVLIQRPHLGGDSLAVAVARAQLGDDGRGDDGPAPAPRRRHPGRGRPLRRRRQRSSRASGCWSRRRRLAPIQPDPTTLALLASVAVTGTFGQFCLTRAYASASRPGSRSSASPRSPSPWLFDSGSGAALRADTLLGFALVLAPTAC